MTRPWVTLRLTTAGDLQMVTTWERDPETAAFVEVWSHERHLAALSDRAMRHFMIECGSKPVGFAILAALDAPEPVVEFRRIVIAEKGLGIGQTAVAMITRHAFDDLGAAEVWLDVAVHNARAAHVYARCGFRIDTTAELWAELAGTRTRLIKMTMTRAELTGRREVGP